MKTTLVVLSFALAVTAGSAREPVKLESLMPVAVEYGMSNCVYRPKVGPWVIDMMGWGAWQAAFWPATNKIVKAYAPEFTLQDQAYKSSMTNLFAVGGELLTGVGLWSKITCMYYWIEYEIPAGSREFTGQLYVTDDVAGANFHVNARHAANQKAVVEGFADGQAVYKKGYWRQGVISGSGAKLDEIKIALPAGAKRLRFQVFAQPFDDNVNNEIVIHNGMFVP